MKTVVIEAMTADERKVFVRMVAAAALRRALADVALENDKRPSLRETAAGLDCAVESRTHECTPPGR